MPTGGKTRRALITAREKPEAKRKRASVQAGSRDSATFTEFTDHSGFAECANGKAAAEIAENQGTDPQATVPFAQSGGRTIFVSKRQSPRLTGKPHTMVIAPKLNQDSSLRNILKKWYVIRIEPDSNSNICSSGR